MVSLVLYCSTKAKRGPLWLSILHVSLAPDAQTKRAPSDPTCHDTDSTQRLTAGDPQTDPLRRTRVSCPHPAARAAALVIVTPDYHCWISTGAAAPARK